MPMVIYKQDERERYNTLDIQSDWDYETAWLIRQKTVIIMQLMKQNFVYVCLQLFLHQR